MKNLLLFILICLIPGAVGQVMPGKQEPLRAPGGMNRSFERRVDSLAGHFLKTYPDPADRIRAIYAWTASTISYDEDKVYPFQPDESPDALIEQTLTSRKAVCRGYSELFNALCNGSGIRCFVAPGFTRQNGRIVNESHVWAVACIDGNWFVFDPTWGSGFMSGRKYIHKLTYDFFMMAPEKAILTHMPFDPMWQCMGRPVSVEEFYRSHTTGSISRPVFSFADSIDVWENLSETERYMTSLRRIEQNGINNHMIYEYAEYLFKNIEAERLNRLNEERNLTISKFNQAVEEFNLAAKYYNSYATWLNRTNGSGSTNTSARSLADSSGFHLSRCRKILLSLGTDDPDILKNIEKLLGKSRELEKKVNELRQ